MDGFGVSGLFGGLIAVLHFIIWIVVLFDIITSRASIGMKVLWALLVFFLPCVGLILYLILGRNSDRG